MIFLCTATALAQGTQGGRGADPMVLQADGGKVRVQQQSLEYHLIPLTGWQLQARYVYANPGARPLTLRLGLAEERCEPAPGRDCGPNGGKFNDLVVLVDGAMVPLGVAARQPDWGPRVGAVYELPLSIPPRATREVRVSLTFDASDGIDFRALQHLPPPAGSLDGPIGQLDVKLTLPRPTWFVTWPASLHSDGPRLVPGDGATRQVIAFTARDWIPEELIFGFPGAAMASVGDEGPCAGWEGDLPAAALAAELDGWSRSKLEACRDHFLALYGATPRPRYASNPYPLPPWASGHGSAYRPSGQLDPAALAPGERAWLEAVETRLR